MTGERLPANEVVESMASWPAAVRRLGTTARRLVLELEPELAEKIAFRALCYYKPGRPYGVIGGHVCSLDERDGALRLGFIHGASLPDPEGLLEGSAKAARHAVIRDAAALRSPAVRALIRASIEHDPAA